MYHRRRHRETDGFRENAARAHSQGVEFQATAMPVRGLELFAGFGYTESKFDDFRTSQWNSSKTELVEYDYEDNYLPYAPKYTCNAGVQYRHATGFFCRADFLATGRFYGDSENRSIQKAYQTVNVRAGYEKESFDVYLWSENLFDEEYLTYVAPYDDQSDVGLDGAPRTIGVALAFRF